MGKVALEKGQCWGKRGEPALGKRTAPPPISFRVSKVSIVTRVVAILLTVFVVGLSHFFCASNCQQSHGSGGSGFPSSCLSSFLGSDIFFASQNCQQSQGSSGLGSLSLQLSSFFSSHIFSVCQKCQQSRGSGGSWSLSSQLPSFVSFHIFFASRNCHQSSGRACPPQFFSLVCMCV